MATDKSMNNGAAEQGKKLVLSADPEKAMQQMMDTIDALRRIYVEENAALDTSDTKTFMRLQDRKIKAALNYQTGAEQLRARREDIARLGSGTRKKLIDKQEEFSGVMAENLKAIDRLRRGVQRLNDRIMTSARESAQKNNANYSRSGLLNKNERPVSIGLSESV